MPSPLPILVGVGLLFLVASSSGSAKAAPPAPAPTPKPDAYALGYKAGYADGLAGKPKAPSTTEAAASGNAVDYAKGYADGYVKGTLDKKPAYVPPVVTIDPKTACVGKGVTMTLLEAQEILTARGFYSGTRDGVCNAQTIAALGAYQTNKMLITAIPGTLDTITEASLRTEPVSTPTGFTNATNAFDDGLNYKTAKAPSSGEYMKWFSNGRYVRGYQDARALSAPYPTVAANASYMQGWNDQKNGQPDISSTKFPY